MSEDAKNIIYSIEEPTESDSNVVDYTAPISWSFNQFLSYIDKKYDRHIYLYTYKDLIRVPRGTGEIYNWLVKTIKFDISCQSEDHSTFILTKWPLTYPDEKEFINDYIHYPSIIHNTCIHLYITRSVLNQRPISVSKIISDIYKQQRLAYWHTAPIQITYKNKEKKYVLPESNMRLYIWLKKNKIIDPCNPPNEPIVLHCERI